MRLDKKVRLRGHKQNINRPPHWDEAHRKRWKRQFRVFDEGRAKMILKTLPQDSVLLDAGCGMAELLDYITAHRDDVTAIGLDMSPFAMARAKEQYESRATFVVGDVTAFPFKPESFDYIILSHILEHLDNPEKVLEDTLALLKQNGRIFMAVPYEMDSGDHQWLCNYDNMIPLLFSVSEFVFAVKHPTKKKDLLFMVWKNVGRIV